MNLCSFGVFLLNLEQLLIFNILQLYKAIIMKVKDKVIVVTGGGNGIGRELVLPFTQRKPGCCPGH